MIWVECYPDKEIVRVLGFKGFHAKRGGKGGVISKVERGGVGIRLTLPRQPGSKLRITHHD